MRQGKSVSFQSILQDFASIASVLNVAARKGRLLLPNTSATKPSPRAVGRNGPTSGASYWLMNTLLRISGIGKLVSFYGYIYLNQPRLTRLAGLALILVVGAIHLIETPAHLEAAVYLGVLFVANFAGTLMAAIGIFRGAKSWGWTLGALISGLSLLGYLASRLFGLPSFAEAAGEWDEPLGTLAMILEGLFLAGWISVITGLAVAAPDRRDWHD